MNAQSEILMICGWLFLASGHLLFVSHLTTLSVFPTAHNSTSVFAEYHRNPWVYQLSTIPFSRLVDFWESKAELLVGSAQAPSE